MFLDLKKRKKRTYSLVCKLFAPTDRSDQQECSAMAQNGSHSGSWELNDSDH